MKLVKGLVKFNPEYIYGENIYNRDNYVHYNLWRIPISELYNNPEGARNMIREKIEFWSKKTPIEYDRRSLDETSSHDDEISMDWRA